MKLPKPFNGLTFLAVICTTLLLASCSSDDELSANFPDHTFSIPENTEVGTVVGEIPNARSVTIISGNEDGVFSINSSQQVVLETSLDYETTMSYTFVVSACEDVLGEMCDNVSVTVNVTDVAEGVVFTFMGTEYSIDGGELYDYGPVNYIDSGDPTHYNYDFVVYDGAVDQQNEAFVGSFFIYVELLSNGVSAFQPGIFEFALPTESAEVDGVNYFEYAEMIFDGNQNNSVTDSEDLVYVPFGGTIEVIDNGNDNWTIAYDLNIVQIDIDSDSLIEGSETVLQFTTTSNFHYFNENDAARKAGLKKTFNKKR